MQHKNIPHIKKIPTQFIITHYRYAVHKKENYTDFNFGLNCTSEKCTNSDRDNL
jgi:hypothetical protein